MAIGPGSSVTGTKRHWEIIFHDEFLAEFRVLSRPVQEELIAFVQNIRERGPILGRPYVDTLEGLSPRQHEGAPLRCRWRRLGVAFAFDPERRAIVLVAGDKGGVAQRRFYHELIHIADQRFDKHLKALRSKKG
jgi:hypothetical protein